MKWIASVVVSVFVIFLLSLSIFSYFVYEYKNNSSCMHVGCIGAGKMYFYIVNSSEYLRARYSPFPNYVVVKSWPDDKGTKSDYYEVIGRVIKTSNFKIDVRLNTGQELSLPLEKMIYQLFKVDKYGNSTYEDDSYYYGMWYRRLKEGDDIQLKWKSDGASAFNGSRVSEDMLKIKPSLIGMFNK